MVDDMVDAREQKEAAEKALEALEVIKEEPRPNPGGGEDLNPNPGDTAPAAAVILYRYSVLKGCDVPGTEAGAIAWALEAEFLTRTAGTLTRAEGAAALGAYWLTCGL